jgi:tRNA uridine 5-carboxymethylaminomethyl modification enzyme
LDPHQVNSLLAEKMTNPILHKQKASAILLRPQVFLHDMIAAIEPIRNYAHENGLLQTEIIEETELQIKYESYIHKEQELVDKHANLENYALTADFDYAKLTSLSHEAREKLNKIKPRTIGQATRISGVSPADISVLIVYLGR